MAGVFESYDRGPVTFEVNAPVTGGQLVVPDGTTGKVKPSTANALTVLGVATTDAIPVGTNQNPTVPGAPNSVNASPIPQYTGVANRGVWPLTYAANCAFGELVVAAANGQVTPYTAGTSTFDMVVGRCMAAGGVTAGNVGDTLLSL